MGLELRGRLNDVGLMSERTKLHWRGEGSLAPG